MIWDDKKYTVDKPYPNKDNYKTYYVYKKGACIISGDISEIAEWAEWTESSAKDYRVQILRDISSKGYILECFVDENGYKEYKSNYEMGARVLIDCYKNDLFEAEYKGDISRKVFNVAYEYSWDRHHSYGYTEVENCLDDIVEFVENIINADRVL